LRWAGDASQVWAGSNSSAYCTWYPTPISSSASSHAKRYAIADERNGVLRVSVVAAPVQGQANAAHCKLIAKRADIARGRVSVICG